MRRQGLSPPLAEGLSSLILGLLPHHSQYPVPICFLILFKVTLCTVPVLVLITIYNCCVCVVPSYPAPPPPWVYSVLLYPQLLIGCPAHDRLLMNIYSHEEKKERPSKERKEGK